MVPFDTTSLIRFDNGAFSDGSLLVLAPTLVDGTAGVKFRLSNVAAGDEVIFNILAVYSTSTSLLAYNPAQPIFDGRSHVIGISSYQFAATTKDKRGLVFSP